LGPAIVALFGFALRVWHLGTPGRLSFDEVYYAENAWSMLDVGYAQDSIEDATMLIEQGKVNGLFIADQPTQIVHPEAGKWLIAAGEAVFGMDSFGWRIASAIVGALTIFVLARLVLRMTGSIVVACLAGFLLAIDGLHLTMSRLALLDGFVTFWIVCAVACVAADRDWVTERLPGRPHRPWQWAAGVCFGLACGTKWNGVYVLAVFGVAVVLWEVARRRTSTAHHADHSHRIREWVSAMFANGLPAFGRLVVVAFAVYLATWTGWLINHETYEDRFGHGYGSEKAWGSYVDHPSEGPLGPTADALRSLWHYHGMSLRFHTGEYLASKTHPYQSEAWGWLVLARPVSASVQLDILAQECGAPKSSTCMRETLMLGNPVIWWSGVIGLAICAVAWLRGLRRREPTEAAPAHSGWWSLPVLGVAATWMPWLVVTDRPIFSFYAVTSLPFIVAAIALVLHAAWTGSRTRRRRNAVLVVGGLLVLLSVGASIYFWPIWTYELIPYDAWRQRMWFESWV
jgi:dolichyl-phosphate-mannose--protein O-mannosyl transferase